MYAKKCRHTYLNDDDPSCPATRLSPENLGHGVLAGKLQQGHGVEVRRVRSFHVVVDDGECCGTLTLLQVVFNSTRPIEAEDDEVT